MTDSSALLANTMAVSDTVLYNLKPSAARSRSYRASVAPINASTFAPSSMAIFSIPCGRKNTYIDVNQSYIKFTIANNDISGNSYNLDNNASCFINRVDTFSSGNLLESVQAYNQVYTYLMDFQTNPAHKVGLANMYGICPTDTPASCRQGASVYGGQKSTYCMPLLNSLLGMGADKAFPAGFLNSDVRLEVTWEALSKAVCFSASVATNSWQVIFAELELCYIELEDTAQHMVDSQTPNGNVYLHGNSWRHYVSNLPASSAGVFSTLVPARMASIKSLVLLPRRSTEINSSTSYGLNSRVNPCITSWWYRVGAVLCPARPIQLSNNQNTYGYSESFMEIQKAFHSITSPEYTGSITLSEYSVCDSAVDLGVGGISSGAVLAAATNAGTNSHKNAFALALELETFSGKSNLLLSGLNTLNSNIFFECNLGYSVTTALGGNGGPVVQAASAGNTVAFTLDFFANFDVIYVIQDGQLTARF